MLQMCRNSSFYQVLMLPHKTLPAAKDLEAKKIIPVRLGKFKPANHYSDEPIKKLLALNEEKQIKICTPLIGQKVLLDSELVFEP
ncbi:MAG: hypothetical protein ACKVOM_01680 [Ferruginibacter sp.]